MMRITLRQLGVFDAVARTGSTLAAATDVSLSQSAVSAALNDLERGVEARLFDRVGRRLVLNDNGRALLPAARAVLDGASGIERGFTGHHGALRADLKLAASTTVGNYLLPPILAAFRNEAPDARIEVRIGNTLDVVTWVREFRADMGFIEGPCHAADVTATPWREDELVVFAAPRHALARAAARTRLTVADLRAAPWLLREAGSGTREAVEHALLPHLGTLGESLTLASSEAIKNAVAEGLGISCLSRAVVADLVAARRLRILATTLPRLVRHLSLIRHERKVLSAPLCAFRDLCLAHR